MSAGKREKKGRKKKARQDKCSSQFEKGIGDLQHENMGMAMIVNDKDSFYGATHSKVFIIIL